MTETIKDKEKFYRLYHAGQLGNTIRQWDLSDWLLLYHSNQDPKDVLGWAVRVKIPNNPYMRYELTRNQCREYAAKLLKKHGIPSEKIQVSELCWDFGPTSGQSNYLVLQGEFRRSLCGHTQPPIHGLFTTEFFPEVEKNRMRFSMERAQPLEGLQAWDLLERACDPTSLDMIRELLDRFPDDIIEFACYARPIGVLQCNTIIWEVRNY